MCALQTSKEYDRSWRSTNTVLAYFNMLINNNILVKNEKSATNDKAIGMLAEQSHTGTDAGTLRSSPRRWGAPCWLSSSEPSYQHWKRDRQTLCAYRVMQSHL